MNRTRLRLFFNQVKFYEVSHYSRCDFRVCIISRIQRDRSCVDPRGSMSTRWMSSSRNKYPSCRPRRGRRRQAHRFNRVLLSVSLADLSYRWIVGRQSATQIAHTYVRSETSERRSMILPVRNNSKMRLFYFIFFFLRIFSLASSAFTAQVCN